MKQIKRILSVVLAVLIILPILASCASDGNDKITTGEFYALFIETAGLYYVSQTPTDEDLGYDAEAQAMVDWGLLPSNAAFENLEDDVTKEIVLTACINNMFFVKTGNPEVIKDAKKCVDAQLMANAVATGLVELENGYLDAKETLSKDECTAYINKSLEIDSNSHFEDGTGSVTYDFGEDVAVFTGDDIDPDQIQVFDYTNEQYSIEDVVNDATEAQITASNLLDVKPLVNGGLQAIPLVENSNETFRIHIPTKVFVEVLKTPEVGDKIVYMPWQGSRAISHFGQAEELLQKGFSGILKSVVNLGLGYECVFERLDDEEIVKAMKVDKYGKDAKSENLEYVLYEAEVDGFSIKFEKINNGYSVNVEKTFEIAQNEYNNWRDWTIQPTLICSASITDFHIDCDNISSIFSNSKKEKSIVSLSYKTNQTIELKSGGLRLAPDSNRNGKFASNITKSRFTAGAGAQYVKVGAVKMTVPQLGLTIPITVYLEISVDGAVKIVFDESNNISLVKQNGQIKLAKNTCKSETFEVTGNIDAGVRVEMGINFAMMRKSFMVVYGKAGVNVTVYCKTYEGTEVINIGYADAGDLVHERSEQKDMHFCLDVSGYGYLEFGICKGASYGSFLADILGEKIDKLNKRFPSETVNLLHLEDGISFESSCVATCTRGDDMEVNKEGKIELDSYKESVCTKEQISISVLSVPMKESKIESNGGFTVAVKDPDVARVEYDETLNILNVYALKEGSTEIEIKLVKTKKTSKKKATYYKQEISITVSSGSVAMAEGLYQYI